jgi:ethylbenzene dioxygenase ferredoxin subunit
MAGDLVPLVAATAVADGAVVQIMHGGEALAVYNLAGSYYVTADTCSHGNASLADGYVEGEEVECPFHQGRFHIPSGTPTSLPCAVPIKTYPVTMQDGMVCIAA